MYVACNISSAALVIPFLHCVCYLYHLNQQVVMNVPAVFTIASFMYQHCRIVQVLV